MTMTREKEKLTIYLSKEVAKALKHYAVDNDINNSEAVEKAILALTGNG